MFDVAIGAVIHRETLTLVIREGERLRAPIQHQVADARAAAALLLEQRWLLRHDDPIVYLEANAVAGAVLDEINEKDKRSRDRIIHGLSPATTSAEAGVEFYDRRSELHYQLHRRAAQKKLFVLPAYFHQLAAFQVQGESTKDGKIFFAHVDDVAARLSYFPALAAAAVLAAIDVPRRSAGGPRREHDPYDGELS